MKTMIATNRTSKAVTMMMILTMIFTMGYGQGMLIEGAAKIFQSLAKKEAPKEFVVLTADFSTYAEEEKDSFRINAVLNVFDRKHNSADHSSLVTSFTVKSIDVAYEEELATESWMETSLTEEIETVPALESWMTESFESGIEHSVEVEAWMTAPLEENLEEAIVTEAWMTAPLNQDFESEVTPETWMAQPLYENKSLEQSIETEDWMTNPLYASAESVITVENWMTQPLR